MLVDAMRSLANLLAFAAAADSSSFVAAGRKLGISSSAVGKAVAKLEAELGVRLFHRSTRRVSLTQEGAAYHAQCRSALAQLEDAEVTLAHAAARPAGRLRIGLPTVGYHFFAPHLSEFADRYPDIVLDLQHADRLVDVIAESFDAVIRSVRPSDSQLISRRLGAFAFCVCAAPSYLAARGTPRSPAELPEHRALRFRFETTGKLQPWTFKRTQLDALSDALICNNMEALLRAAMAGLGLLFAPDFLVRDALSRGELRTVLEEHTASPGTFWLLWPPGAQSTAKMRAFIDFFAPRLFAPHPRSSRASAPRRNR
jgi:DNA-binding transcriptional LysR family regulator